jgi:hypothetical protein
MTTLMTQMRKRNLTLTCRFSRDAQDLANAFLAALEANRDEYVFDVHRYANADHESYLAAWESLSAPARAAIKLAIERHEHQGWISCDQL